MSGTTRGTGRSARMPAALAVAMVALGASAVGLPACDRDDLTVAHLTASPDAGDASIGAPCASDSDCPSDAYCEKSSCGALAGVCSIPPPSCDDEDALDPVCGCDGVTYWNDCERQVHAVAGDTKGVCHEGPDCKTAADCPYSYESCAHIVVGDHTCAEAVDGNCWALPPDCEHTTDDVYFNACDGSGCRTSCDAIRTGAPVIRDDARCSP